MVPGAHGTWLVRSEPRTHAYIQLICFPYAGGGASVFAEWSNALPPSVEVLAAQLPARESRFREPPVGDFSVVIAELTHALTQHVGEVPYVLFGHSLGATLAFEVAHELRHRNYPAPEHLVASGRRAPSCPRRDPAIHDLPDDELIDELRRLNCTPEEVLSNSELMRLVLPRLRADFALAHNYRYHPRRPLGCPITVLGGRGDEHVAEEDLRRWQQESTGAFSCRMLDGDHLFLHAAESTVLSIVRGICFRTIAGHSALTRCAVD